MCSLQISSLLREKANVSFKISYLCSIFKLIQLSKLCKCENTLTYVKVFSAEVQSLYAVRSYLRKVTSDLEVDLSVPDFKSLVLTALCFSELTLSRFIN